MPPRFVYNHPERKGLRRILRNDHTPAEYELWKYLRQRRMSGFKFRRQYGIGPYVLDFFCPRLRLGIEVDGATHSQSSEINNDTKRQQFIEAHDIKVVRVLNTDVRENIDGVIEFLTRTVRSRAASRFSSTTSCPPPASGGGTSA